MQLIDIESPIIVDRIRQEFDAKAHHELANNILEHGLFHPPVFFPDMKLLAGERRIRAIQAIYKLGKTFRHNGEEVPPNMIPITFTDDMDEIKRLEAEVAENSCRLDLTWQEKAKATEKLYRLKQLLNPGTIVAVRSNGETQNVEAAKIHTIAEQERVEPAEVIVHSAAYKALDEDLVLATWLQKGDEEVAEAKSKKDALKIITEKLEAGHRAALAREFKRRPAEGHHKLIHGDCSEALMLLPDGYFDVLCFDPPYGMGLSEMPYLQGGIAHHYDDTKEGADKVIRTILDHAFRVTKPKAHIYMFCDFSRWRELADLFELHSWVVWNRPFIWHRADSTGMLSDAERGPRRVYECILFARKGDKRVLRVAGDVLSYSSDREERSAARKPVPLLVDLLSRSCLPGDTVLDPCCGSGPIFAAASQLQLKAVGIEKDESIFGLATKRLAKIAEQANEGPPDDFA